ncbi:putative signal transduction protein with CBS and DRTGG domains [Fictibacillus macauensis ZFHKF-1]|uniref:Putative signal transduction protein with CBS and DRTGG domains n=1 Tax=Fictibacillus macauensis ZFHKF-1 TaxID=1196324 RepID=I8AIC4_9BACL|nr:CBS domain-containing protein [Fictibacillus macauensis]EIT85452.1 putative signal transduction protein with CBS and DRTGG domains [Fictibacillus macauensis ZFHKF-1]
MATKHEQLIDYIESLEIGSKISVRQIAKALSVSEGTAYRAIKEAENQGIVSTIERVGTIRIEKKRKDNIEKLTFAEVVNIVDGQVLGGKEGLHKTLNKFVIGAMKIEAMMRYVDPGSLLIVGNRENAHELALNSGAAVLITGGFEATEEVKKLADALQLPVISSSYDSFTVATMINRAIYDQLIKKEIVLAADILIPAEETSILYTSDQLEKWYTLNEQTGHSRYPVVDQAMKIVGVVTSKDVIGLERQTPIDKVMTKAPITVNPKTSVASCAHMMIWEGIELLPVISSTQKLLGILTRQDVLKSLQMIQKQPQMGETFDDLITASIREAKDGQQRAYEFEVTPQMTNYLGTISYGVMSTLVIEGATRALRKSKKGDIVVENLTFYFIKPVQMESTIQIVPRVLEVSRKFGKVDVELYHEGAVVGKALLTAQLLGRS